MNKVNKVENISPEIIEKAKGGQRVEEEKVKGSIPKIVEPVVSRIGLSLELIPFRIASSIFIPLLLEFSSTSIKMIPLLTAIPIKANRASSDKNPNGFPDKKSPGTIPKNAVGAAVRMIPINRKLLNSQRSAASRMMTPVGIALTKDRLEVLDSSCSPPYSKSTDEFL
jgi:hypothetical protein